MMWQKPKRPYKPGRKKVAVHIRIAAAKKAWRTRRKRAAAMKEKP